MDPNRIFRPNAPTYPLDEQHFKKVITDGLESICDKVKRIANQTGPDIAFVKRHIKNCTRCAADLSQ